MKTIDEMIAVMTAYREGKEIECKHRDYIWWSVESNPSWNWGTCDYRIKEIDDKRYIDMGLPSGKLWCAENEEGFYTFNQAVEKFVGCLPTTNDVQELLNNTCHKWDKERNGMIFYSPKNGNELFFPAAGYRNGSDVGHVGSYGNYWSSTPEKYDMSYAYLLHFGSGNVDVDYDYRNYGYSVRLVR